jgi:hypothetical protein
MRRPYPKQEPEFELWSGYFDVGFCPRCLARLPGECTYPPEEAQHDDECVYCGVQWGGA